MAKRKKTIIAGPIVKTIIYTAPEPQDGKRARAEKSKMTSAAQKAMNDKTARGRLEMLLACRSRWLPHHRAGRACNGVWKLLLYQVPAAQPEAGQRPDHRAQRVGKRLWRRLFTCL